jgi:hypothetical protein
MKQTGAVEEGVVTVRGSMDAADRDAQRVESSMAREVGQSCYLMGLMALMLTVYVGLGLLAVRLFG